MCSQGDLLTYPPCTYLFLKRGYRYQNKEPINKTKPQWVASTNSIDSTDNTATTPTAPTIPGVPTDVTTTASNGTVTLSWTAPEDDGGIDKYQYRVDKNIDSTWGDWIDVPSDASDGTSFFDVYRIDHIRQKGFAGLERTCG